MSVTGHALLWLAGMTTVGAVGIQDPSQKPDPNKRPTNPPPSAQTTPAPTTTAMATNFVSMDDLMGAEVVFDRSAAAGDPAKGDAAKKDNYEGKRGKVKDLVIATSDGRISGLAIHGGEVGDRTILVPSMNLTCNIVDKKPCFVVTTPMTKADFDNYAEFDAKKAEKEGALDREIERLKGMPGAQKSREDQKKDTNEPGIAPDKSAPTGAMAYVLGSTLKGTELNASDKHFGKVRDAAVDFRSNTVAYVLVSHGGVGSVGDTVYIVPFTAARWMREDEKPVLKMMKTSDELKGAPEYKKPDQGFVTAEQMRSADGFWGGRKAPTNPN